MSEGYRFEILPPGQSIDIAAVIKRYERRLAMLYLWEWMSIEGKPWASLGRQLPATAGSQRYRV